MWNKTKQMEVTFGSKSLSADVIQGILDCLFTNHESKETMMSLFGFNYNRWRPSKRMQDDNARFNTILSLSLTCWAFRQLCLPRMFGTIYISHFKTLGLLWRSIQINPLPGSYIHSFTLNAKPNKWPLIIEPSDGLGTIFEGQTMEQLAEEVEKVRPGAWNDEVKREFREYCRKGIDGEGSDPNLENAADLKEALVTIFRSFKSLKTLKWNASGVPFLTAMIEHLETLDCLQSLWMDVSCCEEDFYYPEPPPEGTVHPATPLWRLSKNLRYLTLEGSGPGLRDWQGIYDESEQMERGPRQERREKTLIRTIKEAENLETIDIARVLLGDDEKRPGVLFAILPQLCCIPKIILAVGPLRAHRGERWNKWQVNFLFPALVSLFERKNALEAEDIYSIGKEAENDPDHPLSAFASFLQEAELSQEIAERWNKRYSKTYASS